MRRILVFLAALILWAESAAADVYGRYGVQANVPVRFVMQPPPGNDDGRSFVDDYGAELRVWGAWPLGSVAADEAATVAYYADVGGAVTYRARGTSWYVLSGYLGNAIFYLRVERGQTCEGDPVLAHMELLYPEDAREFYDPMVVRLAKSLGFGPC
ncbi:MAG: hypothetical protein QNJ09_02485 [Paracoccaceae bacterium]|nr:hypothetical protein [Paracoccaceae bacterium]